MEERPCEGCGKAFRPRNGVQRYCPDPVCQGKRKSSWQKQKVSTDPEYKGNQADARKRWQKQRPGYWREYREHNPQYTARNRQQQRLRNQRRRHSVSAKSKPVIANMDATFPFKSGTYRLTGVEGMIANMDVVVELSVISNT